LNPRRRDADPEARADPKITPGDIGRHRKPIHAAADPAGFPKPNRGQFPSASPEAEGTVPPKWLPTAVAAARESGQRGKKKKGEPLTYEERFATIEKNMAATSGMQRRSEERWARQFAELSGIVAANTAAISELHIALGGMTAQINRFIQGQQGNGHP
jgi:hypothetical protein